MTQRLPALRQDEMTEEQRRVFDILAAGRARGVAGPLMAYLRNPQLAEIAQTFGTFCRRETSLPLRLSELAILATVAHWQSAFQWHGHEKLGLEAGISPAIVAAIKAGDTPQFKQQDEAATYEFVNRLLTSRAVPAPVYAKAEAVLGQTALVELIAIVGYYVMGAMTVRAFDLDPGAEGNPFAD